MPWFEVEVRDAPVHIGRIRVEAGSEDELYDEIGTYADELFEWRTGASEWCIEKVRMLTAHEIAAELERKKQNATP